VLPPIYLLGVWLSIVVAIGVTSLYSFQVTEEARKLSDALAATELVLTREQHLTQIDGLAAAAAHELGTPLATIFLISRELEKTVDGNEQLAGDLKTLREQAQALPRNSWPRSPSFPPRVRRSIGMKLSTLIEETVAPHRDFGVTIKVRLAVAGTREPVGGRNPAILYGVGNILENAVDFARTTVEVNAWWNAEMVEIVISDDGPGIPPDLLHRIGEPYLSRRRSNDEDQNERTGLGLGIFIARTLLERTGAKVSFTNRTFPITAPWSRSSGRANVLRRRKRLPKPIPGMVPARRDRLWRPWQALARHILSRHMLEGISSITGIPTLNAITELNDHADRSLLIVEDDKPFLERLSRAMETRGFAVTSCDTVSDGLAQIGRPRRHSPWWICGSATATASTWCRR
jgi:two-component system sensor histidine kinase RegB